MSRIRSHLAASGRLAAGLAATAAIAFATTVWNGGGPAHAQQALIAPGLALPAMNPVRGKHLFASKGCVVCHQVNGVGGTDAPSLDVKTMAPVMNPFEFFAKMWRGARPMIAMQHHELGHQIQFTGQDLADIVAFVHNRAVQRTFSKKDIPAKIQAMMDEDDDSTPHTTTPGQMRRNGPGSMRRHMHEN
jgi:cytochrome c